MRTRCRGLFIAGTDTGVGKTHVGSLIARALREEGRRVGVYKPAASGCRRDRDELVSDDALTLWHAAGSPGELAQVCPQRFAASLAPNLAARQEGKTVDAGLLVRGIEYWLERSDVVLVEGAGGLLSPLSDDDNVLDIAHAFGFPVLVVGRNALGAINQVLQSLTVLASIGQPLVAAGIVLNRIESGNDDPSVVWNRRELERLATAPVLADVAYRAARFETAVDWFSLTGPGQ